MNLKSPITLGLAWILAPLLVTLASAGLGAGVSRLARMRLGPLTLPVGFVAGIALMTFLVEVGVGALPTVLACTLAAVAGAVLGVRGPQGWALRLIPTWEARAAGAAGLVAYGVGMAPLVGSGRSGILGYTLNNDPSVHISAVELIRDHGASQVAHNASSYDFVSTLFEGGYPLGSHLWVLFGSMLGGVDAFAVWAPLIALMIGMLALVAFGLLRNLGASLPLAGVAGAAVACGYLPFSYLAQGGAKEIAITVCVFTSVALLVSCIERGVSARGLLPAALAFAASVGVFGLGALAWLAPTAAVALAVLIWKAEGRRGEVVVAVAVAAIVTCVLAAPPLASSINFVEGSDADLVNPAQVGNLLGAVPWYEAFNVWLSYDYRFASPDIRLLTWPAVLLAALLAALGVWHALRLRRFAIPLALLASGIGAIAISVRYAIYLDAKSYVVLAPALGLATAAGVVALARRSRLARLGGYAAGVLLVLGVALSDAMVYSAAWVTPKERFQELIDIGERYEGQGPVLVHEREDYAKYFLRDLRPWESWGAWQPDRGLREGRIPPALPRTPDFDDYTPQHMARFRLLVERKRPLGSAPPSNFRVVGETPHYRVWRRAGPMPQRHLSLGADRLEGVDRLDCSNEEVTDLLATAERTGSPVRASVGGGRPVRSRADQWQQLGGVFGAGPAALFASRRGGTIIPFLETETRPGRYTAWVQGSFGPGIRLLNLRRSYHEVGDAFGDLGLHSEWHRLGELTTARSDPGLVVVGLTKPWWQAGSRRTDTNGPLLLVRAPGGHRVLRVDGADVRSLCNRELDWVELL